MPFDGAGFVTDEFLQKLDAVRDLIRTPDRWAKGSFHTPDGRYCLRGAMRAIDNGEILAPLVLDAINEVTGGHYTKIELFNDHHLTDHRQVLAILAKARENLVAGRFGAPRVKAVRPPLLRWWWNRVTGRVSHAN